MLSIIIPIHNSEKYLRKCINSIVTQSYYDLEIILVDNNSTDNSLKICKEYENADRRIKVVSESESGAAKARNRGVNVATGEYITFVDSDDYIRQDAYESLINTIKKNNCDLVCFSFNVVDEKGNILDWYVPNFKRHIKDKGYYSGKEIAKLFLTSRDIEGFGWNKVFRKAFIDEHKIMYDESKTAYEDMAVLFKAILQCDKVCLCNEKFYYYRQVKSSLTHIDYEKKRKEYDDSISQIVRAAVKNGLIYEKGVFLASRFVWQKYNEYKEKKISKISMPYSRIKMGFYILSGLRTEKIKTFIKLLLISKADY